MAVHDGQGPSVLLPHMVHDYSSSSCQNRKEKREGGGHLKNSQKLHIPLSVKIHCPELGHVAPLATKKVENVVFILGGCEPL